MAKMTSSSNSALGLRGLLQFCLGRPFWALASAAAAAAAAA
eukprot:CAMPEP_0206466362 /NCGR_PEP_ID=MMETSP0324_2-20121206/28411_1 /ASSEMBLY_ACC=CAM_ASM_000836 /TAXON_ID=2866 /ORGANISM="Crypthecodinium cohnii, Strain Seligo" /LENGTH=40 /DNA_ID= /DNA_START= /DNA_END= /DNA_ORIENTATION=